MPRWGTWSWPRSQDITPRVRWSWAPVDFNEIAKGFSVPRWIWILWPAGWYKHVQTSCRPFECWTWRLPKTLCSDVQCAFRIQCLDLVLPGGTMLHTDKTLKNQFKPILATYHKHNKQLQRWAAGLQLRSTSAYTAPILPTSWQWNIISSWFAYAILWHRVSNAALKLRRPFKNLSYAGTVFSFNPLVPWCLCGTFQPLYI